MGKINCRIPDELEVDLKRAMLEIQRNAPGGAEVNFSTIMRYSLEKYLEEYQERKDKVSTIKINPNKLSVDELGQVGKILSNASKEIDKLVSDDTEINSELYQINKSLWEVSTDLEIKHLEKLIKQKEADRNE